MYAVRLQYAINLSGAFAMIKQDTAGRLELYGKGTPSGEQWPSSIVDELDILLD